MNYNQIIKEALDRSKDEDPIKYSENLSNAISYIKESVLNKFLMDNKDNINEITEKCNSNYTYRTMLRNITDTRSFLNNFKKTHMFNLLEFADATYEIENDDIMLESVQEKIHVVREANERAKDRSINENSGYHQLGFIIDNIYTVLEFCEGDSCYSFYESTIKNIKNKQFHGTGDYEKSQKEYACLVLETCADAIYSGLSQSINSLKTAYNICNVNERDYMNDKYKNEFQLF